MNANLLLYLHYSTVAGPFWSYVLLYQTVSPVVETSIPHIEGELSGDSVRLGISVLLGQFLFDRFIALGAKVASGDGVDAVSTHGKTKEVSQRLATWAYLSGTLGEETTFEKSKKTYHRMLGTPNRKIEPAGVPKAGVLL